MLPVPNILLQGLQAELTIMKSTFTVIVILFIHVTWNNPIIVFIGPCKSINIII